MKCLLERDAPQNFNTGLLLFLNYRKNIETRPTQALKHRSLKSGRQEITKERWKKKKKYIYLPCQWFPCKVQLAFCSTNFQRYSELSKRYTSFSTSLEVSSFLPIFHQFWHWVCLAVIQQYAIMLQDLQLPIPPSHPPPSQLFWMTSVNSTIFSTQNIFSCS